MAVAIICVLYTISPDGHANYDVGETCMTIVNMYENIDLCTIHDRALWARRKFAGPMYQGMHRLHENLQANFSVFS